MSSSSSPSSSSPSSFDAPRYAPAFGACFVAAFVSVFSVRGFIDGVVLAEPAVVDVPLLFPAGVRIFRSSAPALRLSLLDLFGSWLACEGMERCASSTSSSRSMLGSLALATLLQFGGTTLTNLFLGQAPGWACGSAAWPALVAVWAIRRYVLPERVIRVIDTSNLCKGFILAGSWISSAHSVTSWGSDKALIAHYEPARRSPLVFIICGVLASCGGCILKSWLQLDCAPSTAWSPKRGGADVIQTAPRAVYRGILLTVFYYALLNPHDLFAWNALPRSSAKALIACGIIADETLASLLPTKVGVETNMRLKVD